MDEELYVLTREDVEEIRYLLAWSRALRISGPGVQFSNRVDGASAYIARPRRIVIPGGRARESVGEFQWQHKLMASANQAGWDDPRWTAILED